MFIIEFFQSNEQKQTRKLVQRQLKACIDNKGQYDAALERLSREITKPNNMAIQLTVAKIKEMIKDDDVKPAAKCQAMLLLKDLMKTQCVPLGKYVVKKILKRLKIFAGSKPKTIFPYAKKEQRQFAERFLNTLLLAIEEWSQWNKKNSQGLQAIFMQTYQQLLTNQVQFPKPVPKENSPGKMRLSINDKDKFLNQINVGGQERRKRLQEYFRQFEEIGSLMMGILPEANMQTWPMIEDVVNNIKSIKVKLDREIEQTKRDSGLKEGQDLLELCAKYSQQIIKDTNIVNKNNDQLQAFKKRYIKKSNQLFSSVKQYLDNPVKSSQTAGVKNTVSPRIKNPNPYQSKFYLRKREDPDASSEIPMEPGGKFGTYGVSKITRRFKEQTEVEGAQLSKDMQNSNSQQQYASGHKIKGSSKASPERVSEQDNSESRQPQIRQNRDKLLTKIEEQDRQSSKCAKSQQQREQRSENEETDRKEQEFKKNKRPKDTNYFNEKKVTKEKNVMKQEKKQKEEKQQKEEKRYKGEKKGQEEKQFKEQKENKSEKDPKQDVDDFFNRQSAIIQKSYDSKAKNQDFFQDEPPKKNSFTSQPSRKSEKQKDSSSSDFFAKFEKQEEGADQQAIQKRARKPMKTKVLKNDSFFTEKPKDVSSDGLSAFGEEAKQKSNQKQKQQQKQDREINPPELEQNNKSVRTNPFDQKGSQQSKKSSNPFAKQNSENSNPFETNEHQNSFEKNQQASIGRLSASKSFKKIVKKYERKPRGQDTFSDVDLGNLNYHNAIYKQESADLSIDPKVDNPFSSHKPKGFQKANPFEKNHFKSNSEHSSINTYVMPGEGTHEPTKNIQRAQSQHSQIVIVPRQSVNNHDLTAFNKSAANAKAWDSSHKAQNLNEERKQKIEGEPDWDQKANEIDASKHASQVSDKKSLNFDDFPNNNESNRSSNFQQKQINFDKSKEKSFQSKKSLNFDDFHDFANKSLQSKKSFNFDDFAEKSSVHNQTKKSFDFDDFANFKKADQIRQSQKSFDFSDFGKSSQKFSQAINFDDFANASKNNSQKSQKKVYNSKENQDKQPSLNFDDFQKNSSNSEQEKSKQNPIEFSNFQSLGIPKNAQKDNIESFNNFQHGLGEARSSASNAIPNFGMNKSHQQENSIFDDSKESLKDNNNLEKKEQKNNVQSLQKLPVFQISETVKKDIKKIEGIAWRPVDSKLSKREVIYNINESDIAVKNNQLSQRLAENLIAKKHFESSQESYQRAKAVLSQQTQGFTQVVAQKNGCEMMLERLRLYNQNKEREIEKISKRIKQAKEIKQRILEKEKLLFEKMKEKGVSETQRKKMPTTNTSKWAAFDRNMEANRLKSQAIQPFC